MDPLGNFNPLFSSTLHDIFNKFDLTGRNKLDYDEFNGFLSIIGKKLKDDKEYSSIKGFRDWWK